MPRGPKSRSEERLCRRPRSHQKDPRRHQARQNRKNRRHHEPRRRRVGVGRHREPLSDPERREERRARRTLAQDRRFICYSTRRRLRRALRGVGARTRRGRRGFRVVPTVLRGAAGARAGRRPVGGVRGAAGVIFVMLVCFLTLAWHEFAGEADWHLYCKQATKRDPTIAERFKTLPALPHCRLRLRAAHGAAHSTEPNK